MMELAQACLLGVVQGLTEFLPVSSDGHLTLFHAALGTHENALAMDVVLHVGTLLAMVLYFRRDLATLIRGVFAPNILGREERRRLGLIGAATVVTGIIGLSLKSSVEQFAASYRAAGIGFLLTAAVLLFGENRSKRTVGAGLTPVSAPVWHALFIGVVQGAAVWPGLSRSASTIALSVALGWSWQEAGRFSFLVAMPAIVGATFLTAREIQTLPLGPSLVGVLVSFLTGMLALGLLMRFLRARRLWPFALYTLGLGLFSLLKSFWTV
ncbi:MAG: undecaprenyl-diphosphate phosphatase [Elusimicrobia bacterium]|jgi:undecaprenyl-diphosphatase|nr:undecaprenyl-diphosphate phosphatase [Elusimicrobiota bacterium]